MWESLCLGNSMKCSVCGNKSKRKIEFKISLLDCFGLFVLCIPFASILFAIVYGVSSLFVGAVGSILAGVNTNPVLLRSLVSVVILYLILARFLVKYMPKLLNILGYFINYKLVISADCDKCNQRCVMHSYPTEPHA